MKTVLEAKCFAGLLQKLLTSTPYATKPLPLVNEDDGKDIGPFRNNLPVLSIMFYC